MIKTIFKSMSAAAALTCVLALASCSKDSSSRVPASGFRTEIGLRPLSGMATRSAISGTAFPQGYDMMVSAYRNIGSFAGEDSSQDYFEGIQFGYNAGTGSWKSEKGAKYYPLDGTLDFLAVASAGYNVAATGIAPTAVWGESSNVAKKVVLTVPANSAKFDDLLYGAANAQGISASGTPMVFNHAMTSVVFIAKCNVAYDATANAGITIDGITIDGAKHSGTLTVLNPEAGQGTGSLSAEWSALGDVMAHLPARVWNAANLGTNTTEPALSGLNLTTAAATLAAKPFGEAYAIMPPQASVPFTVTYTIHNGFAADGTTKLDKQVQYQYTPTGNWEMGKKNIYNLDFNLTEILINPTVVDWDSVAEVVVPIPAPALTGMHNGHEWVDLGLRSGGNKILFAKTNIGASSETDYGDYFAWGETSVRYSAIDQDGVFTGATFVWNNTPYHIGDDETTGWSKYIPTGYESYSTSGTADNKLTLDQSDDVASVMWGGNWRTPDISEFEQLINNTVYEIVSDSGRPGLKVTGKGDFASSFIIFPAGGYGDEDCLCDWGDYGYYMSRTTNNDPMTVLSIGIVTNNDEGGSINIDSMPRYGGLSVRPVLILPE